MPARCRRRPSRSRPPPILGTNGTSPRPYTRCGRGFLFVAGASARGESINERRFLVSATRGDGFCCGILFFLRYRDRTHPVRAPGASLVTRGGMRVRSAFGACRVDRLSTGSRPRCSTQVSHWSARTAPSALGRFNGASRRRRARRPAVIRLVPRCRFRFCSPFLTGFPCLRSHTTAKSPLETG